MATENEEVSTVCCAYQDIARLAADRFRRDHRSRMCANRAMHRAVESALGGDAWIFEADSDAFGFEVRIEVPCGDCLDRHGLAVSDACGRLGKGPFEPTIGSL